MIPKSDDIIKHGVIGFGVRIQLLNHINKKAMLTSDAYSLVSDSLNLALRAIFYSKSI